MFSEADIKLGDPVSIWVRAPAHIWPGPVLPGAVLAEARRGVWWGTLGILAGFSCGKVPIDVGCRHKAGHSHHEEYRQTHS